MRSYLETIMMFLGLYIILYYDILGFLAEPFMLKFSIILVVATLVVVVLSLVILAKIRGGGNEKDDLP